jgi:uncharacterized protein (DUF427 family)
MAETRQKPEIVVQDLSETLQAVFDGETVCRSDRAKVLFEGSLPPRYYVPAADVHMEYLRPTETTTHCPWKGKASYFSIQVGDRIAEDAVWVYNDPIPEMAAIAGLLCFYPDKIDDLKLV